MRISSNKKRDLRTGIGAALISTAIMATLTIGGTAFAQSETAPAPTATGTHQGWGGRGGTGHMPGVFGTVASVSGDSITVTSKGYGSTATPKTYTVDATNATVTKGGSGSSVSSVAVGDTVMVQGTVSGTSVTATKIDDGAMMGGKGMMMNHGAMASSSMMMHAGITGNGEPVVGGSVTAVSGTTLTVTNKSNVTYTVDASAATVLKDNATSSVAAIAVGDTVMAQGTVNGTSVTASSVIDQGAMMADAGASASVGTNAAPKGVMGGFLGGITGFFQHLFGFL